MSTSFDAVVRAWLLMLNKAGDLVNKIDHEIFQATKVVQSFLCCSMIGLPPFPIFSPPYASMKR